ncbi:YqaJ viral recombinase family nuclease [Streptomyces celluloflavus]|uniref:YqaJ viral recombinase family nuclease n=1 Tax=Streptomyces celluloflavus TaxID=58344 RepID=UPI003684AF3B
MHIPKATLLGVFEPGSPEWDEARSGLTVTATEAPAVVGLSPFLSPFSLWHHKAGTVARQVEPNAAMRWGNRLEPVIADAFAEAHPEFSVETTGTWANGDRPWQRATPDRLLAPADGGPVRLLEIKTSRFGDGFGPAGSDEVPVYYRCQVLWQLDTLSLSEARVVVLIGGQEEREYAIGYDAEEATYLREQAANFLDGVRAGTPPPLDGTTVTYDTVRRLPDGIEDVVADIDPGVAEEYRAAVLTHRRAEETKRRAAAAVLDAMGNAKKCAADGRMVASRRTKPDGTTLALTPNPTYLKAAAI